MLKALLRTRTALLITLPIAFVAGCATHRSAQSAGSAGNAAEFSGATGHMDAQDAQFYAPPAGVSPTDWALANQIRWLLCRDRSLPAESLDLSIQNGRVTINNASSRSAERKLTEALSNLPGVQDIEGGLTARRTH